MVGAGDMPIAIPLICFTIISPNCMQLLNMMSSIASNRAVDESPYLPETSTFARYPDKRARQSLGKQTLTPHQRQLLASLQENKSVIIANADKNLGPVGIDVEHYIKLGLDHLLDPSTYELLTEEQADQDTDVLWRDIHA